MRRTAVDGKHDFSIENELNADLFFARAALNDKLEAILAEGTRRYGKPEIAERGMIRWSAGRTIVATTSHDRRLGRIVMVSTGPGFDACSEEHESITGHPANDYWMRFLPNSVK